MNSPMIIGACEWVLLPELGLPRVRARVDTEFNEPAPPCFIGLPRVRARVDTGARSCALHATDITTFIREDGQWVRFLAHTGYPDATHQFPCEVRLKGVRQVRNSGGEQTERYTIRTPIVIGNACWEVDITLADRGKMRYRMLLGRSAMKQRVLVNPARVFLQGIPTL